jgi:sugar phosphate permease
LFDFLGVATVGGAVGSMVFPKVLGWISDLWRWQGSFLFLSGCCFISVIAAFFYVKPPTTGTLQANYGTI